jgi:pre-mRNA-processing factor 17
VGVNLRSDSPPERCFLPKSRIHTWQGHTKGIFTVRWFPKTAHVLLSCGMDCRIKVICLCRQDFDLVACIFYEPCV